jgi:arginyl-tRNA---protein transferase
MQRRRCCASHIKHPGSVDRDSDSRLCHLLGFSYYASTTSLSPALYQSLLDRCWRRSGSLLYRPNQRQSCCPHYTLRLDSGLLKTSKTQRHTVNRFNKFVIGEDYAKEAARRYPRSREQARKRDTDFDLVERVHEAEATSLKTPPQPAHHFTVTLEEDIFTEEKYLVYENYQRIVHKESPSEISRSGFKKFLCHSPLRRETRALPDGRTQRLGSYHQCYRLDGVLVAIGVLDLLPHCVSAVYFLYHESVQQWNLGKLGALQEIALAKEGGYRWWYLGFYIHNCPKMRYKIDYSPQYILDPESLEWDLLDKEVLRLLDENPYVSLSAERALHSLGVATASDPDPPADRASDSESEDRKSLFRSLMPGIPHLADMLALDLDHVAIRLDASGDLHETSDLMAWYEGMAPILGGIKLSVVELLAAIGPDLMNQLCVDFSRGR